MRSRTHDNPVRLGRLEVRFWRDSDPGQQAQWITFVGQRKRRSLSVKLRCERWAPDRPHQVVVSVWVTP
jgi:hypothetical protein